MHKKYNFDVNAEHSAIVYEVGTEADEAEIGSPNQPGLIVGTSEWGWITEENGRRICAALEYFSDCSTGRIEAKVRAKWGTEWTNKKGEKEDEKE